MFDEVPEPSFTSDVSAPTFTSDEIPASTFTSDVGYLHRPSCLRYLDQPSRWPRDDLPGPTFTSDVAYLRLPSCLTYLDQPSRMTSSLGQTSRPGRPRSTK